MHSILAVDDSASMRQMVSFTLKNAGFNVVEAVDGQDAYEKANSRDFNLVLTDHVGEVCAQGLYQGQSLTCRNPATRQALEQAAWEETEHLNWTERRIAELAPVTPRVWSMAHRWVPIDVLRTCTKTSSSPSCAAMSCTLAELGRTIWSYWGNNLRTSWCCFSRCIESCATRWRICATTCGVFWTTSSLSCSFM